MNDSLQVKVVVENLDKRTYEKEREREKTRRFQSCFNVLIISKIIK